MRKEYSELELRALVLDWLQRHGRWGAHYYPLDTLVNKLSHVVKKNGKRVRRAVKGLVQEDYILLHKGGGTLSLNPVRSREIIEYLEGTDTQL